MFRITRQKGFHLTFNNGMTISVQFGVGNYSDNYDSVAEYNDPVEPSRTAEVAAWKKRDGKTVWYNFETKAFVEGQPLGWKTTNEVLALMNEVAAIKEQQNE
jgi:hypothetical protein